MEPTDLNSPDPTDDKLAAFLRSAASAPLPDDGFSARVLAALPPPRPAPLLARRDWITGSVALGLLFLLAPRGLTADLTNMTDQISDSALALLTALLDEPAALVVCAVTAGILLLTEQEDDDAPVRSVQ